MTQSPKIIREIEGFRDSEKLSFSSDSYFDAFFQYGKRVSRWVRGSLLEMKSGVGDKEKIQRHLDESQDKLNQIEKLANKEALTIKGINYLQRYLDAFYGYCQGVGITYAEGAWLQREVELGCQTIMVQDKKTGSINLVHAEEDSEFSRFGWEPYSYKMVRMKIGDKKMRFFSYPVLVGWGPAIGINESTGFIQVVDDLIPRTRYNQGYFWAMIVAFISLDMGDSSLVEEMVQALRQVSGLKFNSAYAIHMAQARKGRPEMRSIEIIHDQIEYLGYSLTDDKRILAQSNCPLGDGLKRYSLSYYPEDGRRWGLYSAKLYVEMKERRLRLLSQAKETVWPISDAEMAIKEGMNLLARPEGDIADYTDNQGRLKQYISCLPSRWTVAHVCAFISGDTLVYHIGKLLPKPIKGREYSLKFKSNYPYFCKNISEEAIKELNEYKSVRKVLKKKANDVG